MIDERKKDLKLIKETYISEFHYNLINEEFQKSLYSRELKNNNITLYSSYVYEDEESIEFGIYLINTSKKNVELKSINISIYNLDNNIYTEEVLINKDIKIGSAIFREFKVSKENIKDEYNIDNLSLSISNISNIRKTPYINIDIKNLPDIDDKYNNRDIKKFIKSLPVIEENQVCIDIFRVGEIDKGFYIIALFRNSSDREINIKSIPITVENNMDLLIYKGVFDVNDNSLLIQAKSGKIKVIIIPRNEFPFIEGEVIEDYKIKIQ